MGNDSSPKVSVLVFTCDRPQDLKRCLDSLMKQTYDNYEILVIDNGATDEAKEILAQYPAQVIQNKTKKLSYLFNLGWKSVKNNEIITYIADDAEADSCWVENIITTFNKYPKAAVVGGPTISTCQPAGEMHRLYENGQKSVILRPLINFYENIVMENKLFEPGHLCESGAYSMGAALPQSLELEEPLSVDLLTTTSMGIKRSVLQEINGFDEKFFFNHADGDLFIRIKKAGYQLIFNPKVIVKHHVRLSPSRAPQFIGRDTAFFLLKNIRPKTFRGWLGFFINILVLNAYWFYQSIKIRDLKQLQGVSGFFRGTFDYFLRTNEKPKKFSRSERRKL